MVTLETKLANVMGGKNARACDSCIRKRARWYCPADDAFLCQVCDGSVHSANPLARRHDRVRLKTSSLKPSKLSIEIPQAGGPSWLNGFTKKARTPRSGAGRHAKATKSEGSERTSLHHLVPCDEMETSHEEENDEQLLYRVPIFDPFVAELCSTSTTTPNSNFEGGNDINESKVLMNHNNYDHQIHGSLPSEMELAEFAADVESLLGKGLDDESFDIKGLGFSDCKVEKVEREDELAVVDQEADHGQIDVVMMSRDEIPFELSFDYEDSDPAANCTEEEDREAAMMASEDHRRNDEGMISGNGIENGDGKILLRLDYDGVISAWNDQKSPWTAGERPELESLTCRPDCMGGCGTVHFPYGGDQVGMFGNPAILDGGREARVSRYREKRRTRLFAKKIRYEVRKLNAEKRPRMKGRFVKRANLPATGVPFSVHTK